ncbi:MAG: hypothetical protein ACREGA_01040 [Candidatus Saccharimonadales bacterium]
MNDENQPQNQPPPSAKPKRYFDIVPPSKTLANPTSRPIISDDKANQPDPMMVPKTAPAMPNSDDSNTDSDFSQAAPSAEVEDEFALNPTLATDEFRPEVDIKNDDQSPAPDSSASSPENDQDQITPELASETTTENQPEISSEPTADTEKPASPSEQITQLDDAGDLQAASDSLKSLDSPSSKDATNNAPLIAAKSVDENQDELLLPAHASPDQPGEIVVQEHARPKRRKRWLRLLQLLVVIVFVAIVALDLLIDGDVISNFHNLPVTHLFNN